MLLSRDLTPSLNVRLDSTLGTRDFFLLVVGCFGVSLWPTHPQPRPWAAELQENSSGTEASHLLSLLSCDRVDWHMKKHFRKILRCLQLCKLSCTLLLQPTKPATHNQFARLAECLEFHQANQINCAGNTLFTIRTDSHKIIYPVYLYL